MQAGTRAPSQRWVWHHPASCGGGPPTKWKRPGPLRVAIFRRDLARADTGSWILRHRRRIPLAEELGEEIASLSAHLDAAAHRLLECIRQFDEAGGWHEQGAVSCAHWLAWRLGWDAATAREKVRVARALGNLPAIDEAFRSGRPFLRQGASPHACGDPAERGHAAGAGGRGNRGAARAAVPGLSSRFGLGDGAGAGGAFGASALVAPGNGQVAGRAGRAGEGPVGGSRRRFRGNVPAIPGRWRGHACRVVLDRSSGRPVIRRRALPGHGSSRAGNAGCGRRVVGHPGGRHPRFRGNVAASSL